MDGGKHLNYFAKIRTISGAWTALCEYFDCEFRYMLVINGEHFSALNETGKKRVIEHELRHIPYDSEKKGLERHDVEDFREMLQKYGLNYVQGT
jgi:predicted metallopeptidase